MKTEQMLSIGLKQSLREAIAIQLTPQTKCTSDGHGQNDSTKTLDDLEGVRGGSSWGE